MFDGQDREDDLSSVEVLPVIVREHVTGTGEVELYPVWDGEEGSPPKGAVNVELDSLSRETFFLTERFFYRVTVRA